MGEVEQQGTGAVSRPEGMLGGGARPLGAGVVAVLPLLRPLGALGILAALLGRAIGPALPGCGTGLGRAIRVMELAQGMAAQVFVMFGTVTAIALILTAIRADRIPWPVRAAALGLGGVVALMGLTAAASAVSPSTNAALGGCAAVLAIVAAWDARRAPLAGKVALAVGATGAASLLHLGAVAATHALAWASFARPLATASFLAQGLALISALSWLPPGGRAPKVTSLATLLVVAVAFFITRTVVLADPEDPSFATVLLHRAVERLLTKPEPAYFVASRVFAAVLGPLVGVAALLKPGQLPALAGAVALVAVACGAPEAPLPALALTLAALGVALAARDDRGVWAAIAAAKGEFRA